MTDSTGNSSTSNPASLPGRRIDAIHCLLIPMYGGSLLLPNAALAEVITYTDPMPIDDAPDWLLGHLNWREHTIPLISFELASGGEAGTTREGSRIAVLNTLNSNPKVPYVAILVQGIPHLQLVLPDTLTENKAATRQRPSVSAQVVLDGQEVLVPDLDSLEHRIENLKGN
ncbi:MAG: chemotaxis protein CheW [Proteobacteria bacterium]|jgi:chemosensory pili system protein ChpC|nr:chemotaxis protein CheW [Pseudomonadota bacterium]